MYLERFVVTYRKYVFILRYFVETLKIFNGQRSGVEGSITDLKVAAIPA